MSKDFGGKGPIDEAGCDWLRKWFPQYLIDAFSIMDISHETYRSSLEGIAETFVRLVGDRSARAFCSALSTALENATEEVD